MNKYPIRLVKTRPEQVNLLEEAVVRCLLEWKQGRYILLEIGTDLWRQKDMGLRRRLCPMQRRLLQS